jgi:hypothetical protein
MRQSGAGTHGSETAGGRARRAARRVFAAVAAVGAAASAIAQPPPNADPALAPWFRSLQQPGTNLSCCSIADCRATEYRIVHDHYETLIGRHWLAVPPDKILQRTDNPTGHAIVCWTPQLGIMCFVRATES